MAAIDEFFRDSLIILLTTDLLAVVILIAAFGLVAHAILRAHRMYSGTRTVTCPETEDYPRLEVHAWRAAFYRVFGKTNLHVRHCSRWPERRDCGQACTWQIERAPRLSSLSSHHRPLLP